MDIIYGKKADDGPEPDDIIDRDLGSPEHVARSARLETKQLRDVIAHLWPGSTLLGQADEALRIVTMLENEIEVR